MGIILSGHNWILTAGHCLYQASGHEAIAAVATVGLHDRLNWTMEGALRLKKTIDAHFKGEQFKFKFLYQNYFARGSIFFLNF